MKKIFWIASVIFIFISCQKKTITFSNSIAPLIYDKCTPCHRPNQIGKFNIMSYEDMLISKDRILYTIENKIMPPWPADPNYTHFKDEKYLSNEEIKLISDWYKNNTPIGDSSNIPPLPNFDKNSNLAKPDLVIPVKPFLVKGNFNDRFLVIKVPFEIPKDTFIRTVEFVPGNKKVVHHVNGDMVRFDFDKKKNIYDGTWFDELVWDSSIRRVYDKIGVLHDDKSYPILARSVVNYLPGVSAHFYPEEIGGWKVNRKSAFLLNDLHYGPFYEDIWDSSYINVFYAKLKPKRLVKEFTLGTLGVSPIVPKFIIPANTVKKFTTTYTLPQSITVLTINPHMHLLGKSFLAYALKPNGDTIRLIHIPKWDFNWQYFYHFSNTVVIPAGSKMCVEAEFDNTEKNPFNPYHPPKTIVDHGGSMRTVDEMFQFIVSYLEYQNGDENLKL